MILNLPNLQEACTLGLAPTTSSIMMLALGDALAIACMEMRGFKKSDFKVFHPAGKLGMSLSRVRDVMHVEEEMPLVTLSSPLSDAIFEITRCRLGCVGITNEYRVLEGIFTDGDLRRNLARVDLNIPMSELMVCGPVALDPETYVNDAAKLLSSKRIPSAFVCSDGKPIGIIHIHDLLQRGFV